MGTTHMQDQRADSEDHRGTELRLLSKILAGLDNKIVIDVGEDGASSARALVAAGAEAVYAFAPPAQNVKAPRADLAEDPAVAILDVAVGERDVEEHRSLASLVIDGTIPSKVGVLKVDGPEHGIAVLKGSGALASAVTVIAFGEGATEPAGCAIGDVASFMKDRRYSNFVVVERHDRFETLHINDAETALRGGGAVIFFHDTAFPRLARIVYAEASEAQRRLVKQATSLAREDEPRPDPVVDLPPSPEPVVDSPVESRLNVLEEQEQALEAYLRLSPDNGLWRWVAPQLGVLYQHDPTPFHVPEHYLEYGPLPSPPEISIVTPTMNSGQFVTFTIDSVIDQGYPNLQYIIQDGESTDETLKLIEEYGSEIAHTNSARDSGMSQAINRGFEHATGEIMAYLNSDDLLLPGTLHYVAWYFATHPDVDVVYGHRVIVNTNSEEIGRWVLPPHDSDVLSWADYVPQETMFWRRRIWTRIGAAMDESFRFACDWDLLLRFREAGATFVRLPRFLGAFRVHEEQKTSKQLADVGASEMNRLRERYVGRPVEAEEIWRYIQPYLHRHKVYHKLYRLGVLRY